MNMNLTPFNHIGPARQTPEKLAFTVSEVSAAVGIGKTSIYELINRGELKAIKVAGRRLVLKQDLEAFLSSCRDASPEARQSTAEARERNQPRALGSAKHERVSGGAGSTA
jgi:excisionase family DNA binding protein